MRTAWDEVYDRLSAAAPGSLGSDDLEALADAAFWLGRPRESISARRQAYTLHRHAADSARATRAAWSLYYSYYDLDEMAAAGGWLRRAQRHAAELTGRVEPGYVALADADWARYNGKLDDAVAHSQRAIETAQHFDDGDLEALGVATQARILIARGAVDAGVDRLDEAMVAAVSDDLTPFATGWIYCVLLHTCEQLGDVRRASEWTDLAVHWSEERGENSWYPGLCRLHRCEVQSLRGDWADAEREALRAVEELRPFGDYAVADGQYLAGEIRRRRGDYEGAESAFREAHVHGRDPQPGLALLRLAQGDASGPLGRFGWRLLAHRIRSGVAECWQRTLRRSYVAATSKQRRAQPMSWRTWRLRTALPCFAPWRPALQERCGWLAATPIPPCLSSETHVSSTVSSGAHTKRLRRASYSEWPHIG